MATPGTLILWITLFAATNVDDLFVLLGFFSDGQFRTRHVVSGQYLGISLLVVLSVIAALVRFVIPTAWLGFLGLAPIAIGTGKLWSLGKTEGKGDETPDHRRANTAFGQVFTVSAVTLANGGDNVAVYTPLFATRSGSDTAVIILVFGAMTALWCTIAHWMVNHRTIGAPIRRYGHRLLPVVLIALGTLIMYQRGAFEILRRIFQVQG
jgi:cadmium resistance protein CadD (predicted permease)